MAKINLLADKPETFKTNKQMFDEYYDRVEQKILYEVPMYVTPDSNTMLHRWSVVYRNYLDTVKLPLSRTLCVRF
jgi:hypothetical protein